MLTLSTLPVVIMELKGRGRSEEYWKMAIIRQVRIRQTSLLRTVQRLIRMDSEAQRITVLLQQAIL
jgi:type I site-specific restriction-modification system R (restriction) subunit